MVDLPDTSKPINIYTHANQLDTNINTQGQTIEEALNIPSLAIQNVDNFEIDTNIMLM